MRERVQKILSHWGIASRRQAEQMITAGRVQLNGTIATLGQTADPEMDAIEVDGVRVQPAARPELIYLLLNKPAGIVSTCADPHARRTVLDLLPEPLRQGQGVHPVGRLDADSTGALLLTNDGDVTFYLTHPRHHIPKTYRVLVQGNPSPAVLQQWRQGIWLDGRQTRPAQVKRLHRPNSETTLLEIVLREGRNRQIRRVAEQLGYPVLRLHRTAIGPILLQPPGAPALGSGDYRSLSAAETDFLTHSVKQQIDLGSERMPVEGEEYRL